MSQEVSSEQPADPGDSTTEKKPRSKVEKIVVRTFIGLLLLIAGSEALAKFSYEKTINEFEAALDEVKEPITVGDFESKYRSGLTIKTKGNLEGERSILFVWPCVSRRYQLHLTTGDGDQLKTYAPGNGPAAMIPSSVEAPPEELGGDLAECDMIDPIEEESTQEEPAEDQPTPEAE